MKSDCKSRHLNISELKSYIRQRGNSRWFSAVKLPLRTYSLSGRDTSKWINRALRSIGEPPQLYDSAQTLQSQMNLQMQLQNMGFLRATVDVRNDIKGRKLITNYLLHPGQPYFIRHLRFDIQDSLIARIPDIYDPSYVTLRRGMLFNAANLDNERVRITKMLTNHGYYRFNKDFITYRADSIENTPYVDLTLVLHRFRNNEVTDTLHQQYTIGKIQYRNGNAEDSVIRLRPSVLRANTFLEEDALYSAEGLQSTYNHFGRLGAVRYTNIAFRERPQQPVLDCDISVSTNKPSTISFQPEGTNTAGDLGAAATLTYQNRNIFHGSENLTIELRTKDGTDMMKSLIKLAGVETASLLEHDGEAVF